MKYICAINDDGEQEIFIFPDTVNHDCFYEGVTALRNQTWGEWKRIFREVISAGFVDKDLKCYGESETLNVESRGEEDTKLLKKLFIT